MRRLEAGGFGNILKRTHAELELFDQAAVARFFQTERPEHVFLAAAKVGGILANSTYPAEFIHSNLAVQLHVLHEVWRARVKRLLFLGSSCIYPRECPQPIKEEYLLTGPLEPTNRPYAVAKIAGIEMCWSYNRQYGTRFLSVMPTEKGSGSIHFQWQSERLSATMNRTRPLFALSVMPTNQFGPGDNYDLKTSGVRSCEDFGGQVLC